MVIRDGGLGVADLLDAGLDVADPLDGGLGVADPLDTSPLEGGLGVADPLDTSALEGARELPGVVDPLDTLPVAIGMKALASGLALEDMLLVMPAISGSSPCDPSSTASSMCASVKHPTRSWHGKEVLSSMNEPGTAAKWPTSFLYYQQRGFLRAYAPCNDCTYY